MTALGKRKIKLHKMRMVNEIKKYHTSKSYEYGFCEMKVSRSSCDTERTCQYSAPKRFQRLLHVQWLILESGNLYPLPFSPYKKQIYLHGLKADCFWIWCKVALPQNVWRTFWNNELSQNCNVPVFCYRTQINSWWLWIAGVYLRSANIRALTLLEVFTYLLT